MQPQKQKIKKILIIIGIILVIVFVFFLFSKKINQNNNKETKGKSFLDLGSLFTGKRQSPEGVNQTNNDNIGTSGDNKDLNKKNTPFVVAGLPTPTPIAQNIGGGFGTNDINLIPTGENPNNCIGCNDYPPNPTDPTDPTEPPGPGSGFSSVFINAVPSSIHKDDEVTVSWDSYNVNVCTASSFPVITDWNGRVAKTGNKSFTIKTPTTFVVKCTTNTTSVQASDSVAVVPKDIPVCDTNECSKEDPIYNTIVSVVMEASPYIVNKNTTSNLTWDSENATSCNAHSIPQKDDWKGLIGDNEGDANVLLGEEPTTYVLTCTDGKTTGQTDLTISIDTSGIGDADIKDDPVDLCSKAGEEQNPLCKAKDIDYEAEVKMLLLTDEEQSELDTLMKEIAIMSPTLPSNQTVANLDVSREIYDTINSDTKKDIQACFILNKDPILIDALWERGMAGRRQSDPKIKDEWIKKYPQGFPSQTILAKYRAATHISIDKEPPALTRKNGMFINYYAINWLVQNVVIPKINSGAINTSTNNPSFESVETKLNSLKTDINNIKTSGRVANEGYHQGILNAINQSINIIDDNVLADKIKKERLVTNSGYDILSGYIGILNSTNVYTGSIPSGSVSNNDHVKNKLSEIISEINLIQVDPLTGRVKQGSSVINMYERAYEEILKDPSILIELNTFITPPIYETNARLNGPSGNQEDTDCCAYRSKVIMYEWWPYYWRLQEQVEYGAGTKGIDLY